MKRFRAKEFGAVLIGTALFVALTEVQIPLTIVPNVYLHIRVALLCAIAVIFGPVVGGAVGFFGHAIGDAVFYENANAGVFETVWWSWVIAEALFGILVGVFSTKFKNENTHFGMKEIGWFNLGQIGANIISWMIAAPVLSILLYQEEFMNSFEEGAWACFANIITAGVFGTLFGFLYTRIGVKYLGLKK